MKRRLITPYRIYLRAGGRYSDADLLQRFGLSAYQPTEFHLHLGRCAMLADDGEWTLIADDMLYTLWHMPSTRPTIAALGETCDAFAWSIGDCDDSFEFEYYRGSRLVRRHIVADPGGSQRVVVETFGEPLPDESAALELSNPESVVSKIAHSLGIKTNYTDQDVRVYAPVGR